jgi:hypothetical protein
MIIKRTCPLRKFLLHPLISFSTELLAFWKYKNVVMGKKHTKQTKQKHAIQQQKKKTTSKILCELVYDTNHLSRNIRH